MRSVKAMAIVGSREYPDEEAVRKFVRELPEDTMVISGGARGVDTWAETEARARGFLVVVHKAQWGKYGSSAGMIRNASIVKAASTVVAFWDGKSHGTKNTIDKARAAGKKVIVYGPDSKAEKPEPQQGELF